MFRHYFFIASDYLFNIYIIKCWIYQASLFIAELDFLISPETTWMK